MTESATIMVVEDEQLFAKELKDRLETYGYTVPAHVSTGEAAIQMAEFRHPDLIIMDIMLKGKLNGIETAERIHKLFDIPVVYLTAYSDDSTLSRAKLTTPYGYIIKPLDERELKSTIEMALYKHKVEKKLKENEQWLHTTLKSIGDGVITTDTNSCITFMNPTAETLTGWKEKDAIRTDLKDVFKIINEQTHKAVDSPIARAIRENSIIGLQNHTSLISRDGSEVPIADTAAPIRDIKGSIIGAVLVFQDITERKKAEEQLIRLKEELEDRVKERTAELTDVNKMLVHQINERTAVEIQLKKSLEEKVVLLKEVHHRVKNNLQIISSLLCLQSEYIKDKKTVEVFLETQNRVMSMATIHELLYQSDDVASIELGDYIHNLAHELFNSYEALSNDISLEINVENISLDLDKAIPCGLIINEITSNCLKHAFPAGKKGEIVISVHSGNDGNIELIVGDNGIGLPKDIDIQNPETLGLELISTLTEQLGGKLKVDSRNGTKFKLTFKLK